MFSAAPGGASYGQSSVGLPSREHAQHHQHVLRGEVGEADSPAADPESPFRRSHVREPLHITLVGLGQLIDGLDDPSPVLLIEPLEIAPGRPGPLDGPAQSPSSFFTSSIV